jgi:hypothetical protein
VCDLDIAAGIVIRAAVRQASGAGLNLNDARVLVLYLGPA